MNRTFLFLLAAAVIGAWIGSTERLLHLITLAVYGRVDPVSRNLHELFDVLPVAGAFLGATVALAFGARRGVLVGAACLGLGPLLAVIGKPPWVAFYTAAVVRRIFDVTLLAFVGSLVAKQREHRLVALLSFLVCRHAAIELGVNAWAELGFSDLWLKNPYVTEAVCLGFSLVVCALVLVALRRTRESWDRPSLPSPYRASATRGDDELAPRGGFHAALPFALGTCVFVALVTLLGFHFSLRFEPLLGAWVFGAGVIATLAAWKRGTALRADSLSMLGAIAFGAVALIGAQVAGLRSLPGGVLCLVADLALIVVVARTAVTDRGAAIAVLAAVPAMEAFASMTSDPTVSAGYSLLLAIAALASIMVPRQIRAKLSA